MSLYFKKYFNQLYQTSKFINFKELYKISSQLKKNIKNNQYIFVAGNGGSAAIANHLL